MSEKFSQFLPNTFNTWKINIVYDAYILCIFFADRTLNKRKEPKHWTKKNENVQTNSLERLFTLIKEAKRKKPKFYQTNDKCLVIFKLKTRNLFY